MPPHPFANIFDTCKPTICSIKACKISAGILQNYLSAKHCAQGKLLTPCQGKKWGKIRVDAMMKNYFHAERRDKEICSRLFAHKKNRQTTTIKKKTHLKLTFLLLYPPVYPFIEDQHFNDYTINHYADQDSKHQAERERED